MRGGSPLCGDCPKPLLWETNVEVWEVFDLLSGQIRFAGLGVITGFDYASLEFLLRARQIPESEWWFFLAKIQVLVELTLKKIPKPPKTK